MGICSISAVAVKGGEQLTQLSGDVDISNLKVVFCQALLQRLTNHLLVLVDSSRV